MITVQQVRSHDRSRSHKPDDKIQFMRTSPPMLLPIFRSASQARILAAAFLSTQVELSVQDLAARAHTPYATAHREPVSCWRQACFVRDGSVTSDSCGQTTSLRFSAHCVTSSSRRSVPDRSYTGPSSMSPVLRQWRSSGRSLSVWPTSPVPRRPMSTCLSSAPRS